jgi:hydrogenase maturation protein HypF
LRLRKRRPTKPLALLFARAGPDGLATLREYCAPNMEEARCLLAPERPIVLVRQRPGSGLSTALAPGLAELGAMLPYAPLHDLIADAFVTPLVATSGNISGEPVLTNAAEAEQCLGSIADAFLHHDRAILRPADDSVIRVTAGRGRPFRLGRGSAPLELTLPQELASPVLALGGQTKASLALGFGRRVVISPHLGEGGSPRGRDLLEATANSLQRLCGVQASAVICDAHSGFTSARWARTLPGMEVVPVWHHHAHAAAVAGEYPAESRWLCFTWDGVGLGEDGTLWGGEGLLGRPGAWTRVGSFRPFTPIGGEAVAREPWRAAAALAWEIGMDWHPHEGLFDAPLAQAAWRARNNAPPTSSVGRLFDAASAFLGLVQRARHEGEGPMALEAAAGTLGDTLAMWEDAETLPLLHRPDGVWQADWAPLVARLLDQTRATATRAALFHASLARTLVAQANAARQVHGAFSVGLSGGVFQNRLLAELSLHGLAASGFRSYLPLKIPCNDGGLSFGQVVEAAARRRAA